MGHETDRTRLILPVKYKHTYTRVMKLITNSLSFDSSDVAKWRHHVLLHFYKFGYKSAVDAFGVKKSTLYDWKTKFERSDKRLSSLIPTSTKPKNTRVMDLNSELVDLIRSMRLEFGNLSKYKIKPFLAEYATQKDLPIYGTTKINEIIKRRKFYFEGKNKRKRQYLPLKPRIKHAPRENSPGFIEMDSITIYVVGKRYYFITAIDIVTKFAWVIMTKTLSSRQAKDAYITFTQQYIFPIKSVQTDNGHEFLGEFNLYLEEQKIQHDFIYPRSPKINGVVERFNRTIQEEFIERHDEIMANENEFTQKLTKYLIWYNTRRPHYALGLISPTAYLEKLK